MNTLGRRLNERNEFELYWPILLILFGTPVALGAVPSPGSINALVDPFIARVWSIGLVAGALTHLAGMGWKQPKQYPHRFSTTGLVLEMIGLATQSAACFLFIVSLSYRATQTHDISNLIGAGLVVFGMIACGKRSWKVHKALDHEQERKRAYDVCADSDHEHPEGP